MLSIGPFEGMCLNKNSKGTKMMLDAAGNLGAITVVPGARLQSPPAARFVAFAAIAVTSWLPTLHPRPYLNFSAF